MITATLKKIGLTEGECKVYEALVGLGLSTTWNITKKANISSSKVYEVLQRLMSKGLVSYTIKNGVKHYDATPPERLIDFLEEQKEGIIAAQDEMRKVVPLICAKRGAARERNETIVYMGMQGPKIVLKEIIEAGKQGSSHFGFGTDIDPYVKYLPQSLNKYIAEAKKFRFEQRLIFAKGFKSPNIAAKIRYLPKEYLFPVRIMMYGNKVAIIDFTQPITTIIIEKKEIATSFKKHFELLWKIATLMK